MQSEWTSSNHHTNALIYCTTNKQGIKMRIIKKQGKGTFILIYINFFLCLENSTLDFFLFTGKCHKMLADVVMKGERKRKVIKHKLIHYNNYSLVSKAAFKWLCSHVCTSKKLLVSFLHFCSGGGGNSLNNCRVEWWLECEHRVMHVRTFNAGK